MLSAGFNIVGFSWITSPAAIELEIIVLDWLAKALKLPHDFHSTGQGGGVIQGTASEAIGGLNPERYRSLKTDASTNYALSPEVFSEAVSIDIATGLIPFFLCATVGTTSSSTAIDPLPEMRRIAKVMNVFD
ncbi:Tyrosine decarboxylase [Arachis hypogaea]|nr:Tyrosine decarboxylase [Arachis hypogaea]